MVTLIYRTLWRSTENGNWSTDEVREQVVTREHLEKMKANCELIGATYSEKYNEFFIMNTDRLHATKITVKD